jgi:hypothetical protein
MIYKFLLPVLYTVNTPTYKHAIKEYLEINKEMRINQLIMTDQNNHMQANIKYFNNTYGPDKVGITMYPLTDARAQRLIVQGFPVQGLPVQSQPVQSQPVQSQPVQSQPVQSQPVQDHVLVSRMNNRDGYPEFSVVDASTPPQQPKLYSMVPMLAPPMSPIVSYDTFMPTVIKIPIK